MIKVLLMILFMVTFVDQSYFYISIFAFLIIFVVPQEGYVMDLNDSALKKGWNLGNPSKKIENKSVEYSTLGLT